MVMEEALEEEELEAFALDALESCFLIISSITVKTADDYAAASLIYQHGDTPDHYFQAFIWAMRAVELGQDGQKGLVAVTIDRYLVSIGKKQLFGSQAFASEETLGCACLEPVEMSFPETVRKEYSHMSLQDRYDWLASINTGKNCSNEMCSTVLQPSPQGTVPGFW